MSSGFQLWKWKLNTEWERYGEEDYDWSLCDGKEGEMRLRGSSFPFCSFFTIRLRSQNCKRIQQCMYTMNLFISLCRCFQRQWDRFSKGFKDSANSRYWICLFSFESLSFSSSSWKLGPDCNFFLFFIFFLKRWICMKDLEYTTADLFVMQIVYRLIRNLWRCQFSVFLIHVFLWMCHVDNTFWGQGHSWRSNWEVLSIWYD